MSKLTECVAAATKDAKEKLGAEKTTKRRLDKIAKDIELRAKGMRGRDPTMSYEESYRTASKTVLDEHEQKIAEEERRLAFQKAVTKRNWARLERNNFSARALHSFLESVPGVGEGLGHSLNGMRSVQELKFLGDDDGWVHKLELKKDGDGKELIKKTLNRENHEKICQAILDIKDENADALKGVHEDIKQIAQVIVDKNERERVELNRYGASIPENKTRIAKTRWNPVKMKKMGFEAWYNFESPLIDFARSFPDVPEEDYPALMKEHYDDMTTGIRAEDMPESINDTTGFSKFYRSLHKRRVFYFKDGQSWLKHQTEIGDHDLIQSLAADTARSAKDLAMLRQFGPHAYEQFDIMRREVIRRGNMTKDGITDKKLAWIFKDIDGLTSIPANYTVARIGTHLRRFVSWAKLGLSTVNSFSDLGMQTRALTYNGMGLWDSMLQELTTFTDFLKQSNQHKEWLELVGLGTKDTIGAYQRFDVNSINPGVLSAYDKIYYKLNLLQRWDRTLRTNTAAVLMRHMAQNSGKLFKNLEKQTQIALTRSGITEKEWDVLRAHPIDLPSGMKMIAPESADIASEESLKKYLGNEKPTKDELKWARDELHDKVMVYAEDSLQTVILASGPSERYISYFGTQRGTIVGEAMRFLTMFTTYPTAFVRRVIGRELIGTAGLGDTVMGLAQLSATLMFWGGISYSASSLLRGKKPNLSNPYTIGRIAASSFGRYGDMLFSILGNTSGKDQLVDMIGGGARTTSDFYGLLVKLFSLTQRHPHRGSALWHFARRNIPFANLWFINGLFRHYILDSISDMIEPGSVHRSERYMRRLTGETPLFQ